MRANKQISEQEKQKMTDKMKNLEKEREKLITHFTAELEILKNQNEKIQKNYEDSTKKNANMEKIIEEHQKMAFTIGE